jgi:hypothetical protein
MKLTRQEQKVYDYILAHRGCTTHHIQRDLFIECPSARITGLRTKGVDVQSIGQKKYPHSRPFEMYAIGRPLTKMVSQVEIVDGVARERWVELPVSA